MLPAIIVVTFNRPNSLKRLLSSLSASSYPSGDIPLIISIDFQDSSNHSEVVNIANQFQWQFGSKKVIEHKFNIGLRAHVLSCGDLCSEYEAIVMLEDDLLVSPYFYNYACQALHSYDTEEKVGGISLYNHKKNINNKLPFEILGETSDIYFLQIASSWGQAWSAKQWYNFRRWYEINQNVPSLSIPVPQQIEAWPETSWLKYFIKFLVATDRYFVYPKIALSTNYGDSGTHNKNDNSNFQVSLCLTNVENFRYINFQESINIYDSYFEILPSILSRLNPDVPCSDLVIDLYGTKRLSAFSQKHALSSKKIINDRISHQTFGLHLKPMPLNIVFGGDGDFFHLSDSTNFSESDEKDKKYRVWKYFYAPVSLKTLLLVTARELLAKSRIKEKLKLS